MINLKPKHLQIIKDIFTYYLPKAEIRVFGSRLTENYQTYSDLDLAVVASEKLTRKTKAHIKYALEESDLPFRIDLLDWHTLSDNFKKIIEKKYHVL